MSAPKVAWDALNEFNGWTAEEFAVLERSAARSGFRILDASEQKEVEEFMEVRRKMR